MPHRFVRARARCQRLPVSLAVVLLSACVASRGAQAQARVLDLTGAPDARLAEPFTLILGVRELVDGRVIVADPRDRRLMLADFGSGDATPIGRAGSGPGEYQFLGVPLAGPRGTTRLVDPILRRVHVITAEGRFAAQSLPFPAVNVPGGISVARGTDARGRLYFEGSSLDEAGGRFLDSVFVVRWTPEDRTVERLTRVANGGRVRVMTPSGPSSFARTVTPFPHLDAWMPLPDGRVMLVQHTPFRIDVIDANGRVQRGAVLPHTALPVTAAERAAFRARTGPRRVSAVQRDGGSGPPTRGPEFPDDAFPETMPPFIASSVRVTPTGEVWIGRSFAHTDRTRRYDIVDGSGRLVGSAVLPAQAEVVGFGAGAVYVARTDPSDDLVYLVRHRR